MPRWQGHPWNGRRTRSPVRPLLLGVWRWRNGHLSWMWGRGGGGGAGGRRVGWRLGGERLDGYGAVLGDVDGDAAAVEQRHADYGDAPEFVGINPVIEFMPEHFDRSRRGRSVAHPRPESAFQLRGL